MLRIVKIMLVSSVVVWGLVGGVFNILHWSETTGSVGAVTSMSTWNSETAHWQATSSPILLWLGATFIMSSKLIATGLCGAGAVRMWQARKADAPAFAAAKTLAIAGCGVAMFMLFFGFIVIAESWYELWRSEVMLAPVLGSAFRYGAMITLIALFVSADND